MKLFKEKEKTYKFNKYGYAQALLDIKNEKINKINNVTNIVLLLVLFGVGVLSKEFLIFCFAGKGIDIVTNWLIG